MADFIRLRNTFEEADLLLEGIDKSKVKITGSYLWYPYWDDIDCATYSPDVCWALTQNANKHRIRIDCKVLTKEKFDELEHLLTFCNFCMCYYQGKLQISPKWTNSQVLIENPDSVKIFNNISAIRTAYQKCLQRGFLFKPDVEKISSEEIN
jgi:hypothetical protein